MGEAKGQTMDLRQGEALAREIIEQLAPFCKRIEVVGSIRRRRPFVHDIDLLLIPANPGKLLVALQGIGEKRRGGGKNEERRYKGEQVDLYFATPDTWACLLLIRTGSAAHNIKLTSLAKGRGWHLYASGGGLVNEKGERVAGETEESFFAAFGLRYLQPWEREP